MKIFRATHSFRASASCSKNRNDKKYFNTVKNSRAALFFRTNASCSKLLNVKSIFNTVKHFWATLFFRASASAQKSWMIKNISIQWKIPGKLCFQGKLKLLKILNVRSIFTTAKISGQLCFFQGKRKLLKNRELWKNFQYSVYSLCSDRVIWASVVCNQDQRHDWL